MTVVGGLRTIPMLFAAFPDLKPEELYIDDFDNNQAIYIQEIALSSSPELCRSLEVLRIDNSKTYDPEKTCRLIGPTSIQSSHTPAHRL